MRLAILDFSMYGNPHDPQSDNLLARAAQAEGCEVEIVPIASDSMIEPDAECAWLRYDLRSLRDLRWIVDLSERLCRHGYGVFPPPHSIFLSEDKWESFHSFRQFGIETPDTFLASDIDRCGYPAILKPRVGWGAMGVKVLNRPEDQDQYREVLNDDHICQQFIPHHRTWIETIACGCEIACIEELKDDPSGDIRASVISAPPEAAILSASALDAVGLVTGTADLIHTPSRILVLEVNSAPRITYPDLSGLDLAGPMVRAVLDWMRAL